MTYINPKEAVSAFDNLLASGNISSIEEFIVNCSFDIRDEIRPLLELMILFRDSSRKAPPNYFETLLTKKPSEKFEFPFRTTESIENFERRSLIDEIMPEVSIEERRSIINENIAKDSEDRRGFKLLSKLLGRIFRREKRKT